MAYTSNYPFLFPSSLPLPRFCYFSPLPFAFLKHDPRFFDESIIRKDTSAAAEQTCANGEEQVQTYVYAE